MGCCMARDASRTMIDPKRSGWSVTKGNSKKDKNLAWVLKEWKTLYTVANFIRAAEQEKEDWSSMEAISSTVSSTKDSYRASRMRV